MLGDSKQDPILYTKFPLKDKPFDVFYFSGLHFLLCSSPFFLFLKKKQLFMSIGIKPRVVPLRLLHSLLDYSGTIRENVYSLLASTSTFDTFESAVKFFCCNDPIRVFFELLYLVAFLLSVLYSVQILDGIFE